MRNDWPVLSALVVLSTAAGLLALELGVRHHFAAWPFETSLQVPDY